MLKKILITFMLFVILTTSIFAPVVAAEDNAFTGNWYDQSFNQWWSKVYDSPPNEIFGERYTAAQVQWVIYGLFAFILRSTTGNPELTSCVMKGDIEDCKARFTDFLSNLPQSRQEPIAFSTFMLQDRSLSGITYIKNLFHKFSLVPKASAQSAGFGFQVLNPILPMWRASRDIAFALMVIVTVVLAFMIMFRVKINPQTVISVQSALPKVIGAVILITFSYAIAGLLIDLMYVVIGLVSLMGTGFFPEGWHISSKMVFNLLTKGQPTGVDAQFGILLLAIVYMVLFSIGLLLVIFIGLGAVQFGVIGAMLWGLTAGTLPLIMLLVLIILLLIALWAVLKTIWTLVKALANVLLSIIFAPLQIMIGSIIPTGGFGPWLRGLASNLSVFVVTGAMILLSYSFLLQGFITAVNQIIGDGLVNGILTFIFGSSATGNLSSIIAGSSWNSWPPLLGGGQNGMPLIFLIVSFVIFTLIPKTSDIIKAVIEKKPFPLGTAIGETLYPAPARMAYDSQAGRYIREGMGRERAAAYLEKIETAAEKKGLTFISDLASRAKGYTEPRPRS